jgi:hypothetical protein
MDDKNSPKLAKKFVCEKCDYKCSKQSDYDKHILTLKHKMDYTDDVLDDAKVATQYFCECGKEYKHRQGLWKHKKKCQNSKINEELNEKQNENISNKNDQSNKDNLIEYLIKENSEFKSLIMELIKKDGANNTMYNSNNNINSNNINNSFNLQFFLNEQCKDAINISEFVDNIKMQLSDLEMFGHTGYVEGVSKILIKNLNELDVIKRPIHCSDLKREVLYIKDNDKWSKENEDKQVIKKAIKDVANKNIRQIPEWMKKHPDCKQSDSKKNDQYLKIVMNAMSGGSGEEQNSNIDKIIKNITKSVIIEK